MKPTTDIEGWFNYANTYNDLIYAMPHNGTFVECGAWLGKSSSYLCDKVSETRPDIKVYIVDSWEGSKDELDTYHKLARETDIYQLFLDNMGSRKFTPIKGLSEDAVKQFQDESIDVVFIDMCHLYECVKEDLQLWYPKVKYNGYIAGHDWSWPGVKEALFEIFPGHLRADGDCWLIQKTSGVYHGT